MLWDAVKSDDLETAYVVLKAGANVYDFIQVDGLTLRIPTVFVRLRRRYILLVAQEAKR